MLGSPHYTAFAPVGLSIRRTGRSLLRALGGVLLRGALGMRGGGGGGGPCTYGHLSILFLGCLGHRNPFNLASMPCLWVS